MSVIDDWVRAFVASGFAKKEDIVNGLVAIVKKKYENEGVAFTKTNLDSVYYSLSDCYEKYGFAAARTKAQALKVRKDL